MAFTFRAPDGAQTALAQEERLKDMQAMLNDYDITYGVHGEIIFTPKAPIPTTPNTAPICSHNKP